MKANKNKNDNKSNETKNNPGITNDRKVPNEISPPMPKPERKEEDNDFTKGDKNDPLRKEKIDIPSKPPLRREGEDDDENYIREPVAKDENKQVSKDTQNKLADESLAKTDDAQPKTL